MAVRLQGLRLAVLCFLEFAALVAQSGKGNVRGGSEQPGVVSRRLLHGGFPPRRDPDNEDRFECDTTSCAPHDSWERVKGINATKKCDQALSRAMTSFAAPASPECKVAKNAGVRWQPCKQRYCQMYASLQNEITYGGTSSYSSSTCAPFVNFNQTLCDHWYRDADDFCECICPALTLLDTSTACETTILGFFLLGRRGAEVLRRYTLDGYCLVAFCDWIEKISDPRKQEHFKLGEDVPGCLGARLPFQRAQCKELMKTTVFTPYTPCPWETDSGEDYVLQCSDGYRCDARTETWACCQRHGYKAKCPRNFPVMCANPLECVGDSDHCCVEVAAFCSSGVRLCSPLLAINLPEWTGVPPAHVPLYIGPSTTMDDYEYNKWKAQQVPTTTKISSFGTEVTPYLPVIIPVVVLIAVIGACRVCYVFGSDTQKNFMKTLIGVPRFMALFKTDIVHVYRKGEIPKEYPPLPPRVSTEDILRYLAQKEACERLQEASTNAFKYGTIHLVSVHFSQGFGPRTEAKMLEEAIADIKAKGLEDIDNNAEIIERGERWCKTLKNEIQIVESMEKAFPILTIDWRSLTKAPVPGKPWQATTVGLEDLSAKRNEAWSVIEDLSVAINFTREGGASPGLIDEAIKLKNDLVARTPELPADRCVLDPDGHGVKLLPKGKQRAVWVHTGETYMYDSKTQEAGKLEDFELPPSEELGGVTVDLARPVCAHYAKAGKCKNGRRCPWRHCKPVAGDSIREPITF